MTSKEIRADESTRTDEERAAEDPRQLAERIRWPDGPVCPYCGERERVIPEPAGGRLRYECPACRIHYGHFRRPGAPEEAAEGSPRRRTVAPRFPRGE